MNSKFAESLREIGVVIVLFILILFLFALQYFMTHYPITGKVVQIGEDYLTQQPSIPEPVIETPRQILSQNLECWKNAGLKDIDLALLTYLLERTDCLALKSESTSSSLKAEYVEGCFIITGSKTKANFCPSKEKPVADISFDEAVVSIPNEETPISLLSIGTKKNAGTALLVFLIVGFLLMVWREYELRHVIHGFPEKKKAPVLIVPRYKSDRPVIDVSKLQVKTDERINLEPKKTIALPEEDVEDFMRSCKKIDRLAEQGENKEYRRAYIDLHGKFASFIAHASKEQRALLLRTLRETHQKIVYADTSAKIYSLRQRLQGRVHENIVETKKERPIEDVLAELRSKHANKTSMGNKEDVNVEPANSDITEIGEMLEDIARGKPGSVERYRKWKMQRKK